TQGTEGQDREEEQEGMGPQARVQTSKKAERRVDQIGEDRPEEDPPIIDAGRGFPGEEPCEAKSNAEMAEEEHRGSSRRWRGTHILVADSRGRAEHGVFRCAQGRLETLGTQDVDRGIDGEAAAEG